MSAIFGIFATPFGIIMRWIYEFIGSYGLSVIIFAVLSKLVILPLTIKQKRSMIKTQRLQPKIQAIQRQFGKDQQRMQRELQDLYDREGTSPTAGCGTTLITFPIMIGLYYVISQPLTYFMRITAEHIEQIASILNYEITTGYGAQMGLASEIFRNFDKVSHISPNLLPVDFSFLGIDLTATPAFGTFNLLWFIPIISGLLTLAYSFISQKTMAKLNPGAQQNDQMAKTNNMMMLMMPAMSIFIGFSAPVGLSLYWITNYIVMIVQDYVLNTYFARKIAKGETID